MVEKRDCWKGPIDNRPGRNLAFACSSGFIASGTRSRYPVGSFEFIPQTVATKQFFGIQEKSKTCRCGPERVGQ